MVPLTRPIGVRRLHGNRIVFSWYLFAFGFRPHQIVASILLLAISGFAAIAPRATLHLFGGLIVEAVVFDSQVRDSQEGEFEKQATSSIFSPAGGQFQRAEFDLGVLPAGQKGKIALEIRNSTATDVIFENLHAACACSNATISEKVIRSESSVLLSATLVIPDKSTTGESAYEFWLEGKDRKLIVQVIVKFRISGLLAFATNQCLLEVRVDEQVGEVFVPFMITEPVKKQNLEITVDESLRDLSYEIVQQTGGKYGLLVRTSKLAVGDGPTSGVVTLTDKVLGRNSKFALAVRASNPVSISPSTVFFQKVESDSVGKTRYRATVLLVFNKPSGDSSKNDGFTETSTVELDELTAVQMSSGDTMITGLSTDMKRLNPRVIRVTMMLDLDAIAIGRMRDEFDGRGEINWAFRLANGNDYHVETEFRFSE